MRATPALFLATFTYALTVLRAVPSGGDAGGGAEFVPKLAVTLAFLLAVASVIGLVLFLAHLIELIRVETMLRNVHRDATSTARAVLRPRNDDADRPAAPSPNAKDVPLLVYDDGFLTWIEQARLLRVSFEEGAVIRLDLSRAATWSAAPRSARPGRRARAASTRRPWTGSPTGSRGVCGWASSGPGPRTWGSACASSPTPPPRRSRPASTIRRPRSTP